MFEDNILYEDDSIIVINKPPYFPVQSAKLTRPDCVSALKNLIKERDGVKGEPYIGLIHRLDEPVEGIMVFAKNKNAASVLSKELTEGGFSKEYTAAVILGDDDPPEKGELTDMILTDRKTNMSSVVPAGTKGAKEAKLEYSAGEEHILADGMRIRLLKVLLYTGRHHQIRVQLANAGMPIAGDRKYAKACSGLPLCLAATGLSFDHPSSGKRLTYSLRPAFIEKIISAGQS
ncbi:MAG: RluA family pseudouridine synthase [Lachnospiraceae bacterium]|nr:RluA family pseudouridine synthase [Lachnospiraceae bacterium]